MIVNLNAKARRAGCQFYPKDNVSCTSFVAMQGLSFVQ